MAASIKIEFDDGSKVMERVLGDVDPATPLGFVKGIDIDLAAVGPSAVEKATPRTDGEIDDFYENKDVARYINRHKFNKVGFQLPDDCLVDAPRILKSVREYLNELDDSFKPTLFVLGDTSYGDCCVDEVAASHMGAQSVIHYGRSCLQQNATLPVKFVFGKSLINAVHCAEQLLNLSREKADHTFVVLHDVAYAHCIPKISELVGSVDGANIYVGRSRNRNDDSHYNSADFGVDGRQRTYVRIQGQYVEVSSPEVKIIHDKTVFVYIGTQSPRLVRLLMRYNMHEFLVYDAKSQEGGTAFLQPAMTKVGKLVRKRYFQVEKAKDAAIFGILVGTLSVARYKDVLIRVKDILKRMGRKYYTFIVGKINVAKLANHSEVDVYVLIACPESSLLDSKEFYKPIVTPFELELALNPERKWDGTYSSDFNDLLQRTKDSSNENIITDGKVMHMNLPPETLEDGDEELPYMSLVDGKMKMLRHTDGDNEATNMHTEVVNYAEHASMTVRDASEYMNSKRTFKGLEQKLGETQPMKAVQGLSGIAQSYISEPKVNSLDSPTETSCNHSVGSHAFDDKSIPQATQKVEENKPSSLQNVPGKSEEVEDQESIVIIRPLIDSDSSSEDDSDNCNL